jgi:hypothetical protein
MKEIIFENIKIFHSNFLQHKTFIFIYWTLKLGIKENCFAIITAYRDTYRKVFCFHFFSFLYYLFIFFFFFFLTRKHITLKK